MLRGWKSTNSAPLVPNRAGRFARRYLDSNPWATAHGTIGTKPSRLVQWLYRLATKIPYDKDQIDAYIKNYKSNSLRSERHLAGGCLIEKAIDDGANSSTQKTGLVHGCSNVFAADLSIVPLPRCSPQMTAYLVGHHVANQLYPRT